MLKEVIDSNLGSGRFWLTIITGTVFAYVSIKGIIPAEAIASIITMVFVSYFSKERTSNGSTGKP
jgi:hypothetical protein